MQNPKTEVTVSMAELGINPGAVVENSQNGPITILADGCAVAYVVSAEHYEMLRKVMDEAALANMLMQRQYPKIDKGRDEV